MAIHDYLSSFHVPYERFLHQPAASATRRAQRLHVPGHQVAKAVLVRTSEGYILAVLPATHRIDWLSLASCLGEPDLRLATEDEIELVFNDCERGALPPFGHAYGLRTVVDPSLARDIEIIVEGNFRHEGLRLRYDHFVQIENPLAAPFARAAEPNRPGSASPHRH